MQLRDYQESSVALLRAGVKAGHRTQVLCVPTGGGKTEIAIALMLATSAKGNHSAMVMDRIVLCDQTSARLAKYGVDHGVLQAGHWRERPHERIQVCSAQTLERRDAFPRIDLLIVDECHVRRRHIVEFIRANPKVMVVGLTATPFTEGLGRVYTNVVSPTTTAELVGQGHLVPLKVFVAKREINMAGAKKVGGEWSQDEAGRRGIEITGNVVAEWVKKTHEFFGGPRKTIVFCASVAHGEDLARKFLESGYNFALVSYRDTSDFKQEAIEEFRKTDSNLHGLIACDILTKGFDVPDVMIGISARPYSKSLSMHIQQMGRVMRGSVGKEFALWLDHSGNYLRFREDWEQVYHHGVDSLNDGCETPKREPTAAEKKELLCPDCNHLWPVGTDTCPHCGHVRERRSNVVVLPGRMEALDAGDRAIKQAWWSGFLYLADQRHKSRGWALAMFKEKFGVWPDGLEDVARPPPPDCVSWETSRRIAWAKSPRKSS